MGREFLEGNEAIARGAIAAKCDFFAGYPITPASSILHYMMDFISLNDGIAIQAEDEIASMGFCIAAAMAGRKVMTATSGPGISLYSENIGLAVIGETPMVIVNVQRQGPATGSATKGAEGDIQFIRWVTSGGLPVIALNPANLVEAYQLTYIAFNMAEKYRTPVFLLTNKELAITRESVDLTRVELPPLKKRKKYKSDQEFLPHYFDHPAEVPLMSDIGAEHIVRFTTSTHDKSGYLTNNPQLIQEMLRHYSAKIVENTDQLALVKTDLEPGAETLIISYGIVSKSVAVAVKQARSHRMKLSSLVLQTLWPVPVNHIKSALNGIKKVLVPEMNLGQYVYEIERLVSRDVLVIGINKMDTTLISPEMILKEGGLV
jgi:2-oxoglutarate ferredoxin oxidoreductase subunit alpha